MNASVNTQHEGEAGAKDYSEWIRLYDTMTEGLREELRHRIASWTKIPKISVLMPVLGPCSEYLNESICSVRNQIYQNWELCIAADVTSGRKVLEDLQRHLSEDSRMRLVQSEWHGCHSAISNAALEMATGDYCAVLNQEDLLSEHALFHVTEAILKIPDAGLIYSDEDKLDLFGRRTAPNFKSDWNLDLFRSQNMISHLAVYRTALLRVIRGFRKGFEGSEGYDLALRAVERLRAGQIVHIPRILYHSRADLHGGVNASEIKAEASQAGRRALHEHLSRSGIEGYAESLAEPETYRVRYDVPTPEPLVSLIIPTRNREDLVKKCVESICQKTEYKNYEIIIVDNGSDDPKALSYFEDLKKVPCIRVLRDEGPFNYSALNNAAVKNARGEIIGLINNDIEVISAGWLGEMVSIAIQPGVGVVGARLWYPNDTLQHGGVIMGLFGLVAHAHRGLPKGISGYQGRAALTQSLSAVTGACMVVLKSVYEEVNGLNEKDLKVGYNDIDFCLKIVKAGYRNVWTPHAELYHHESLSRGVDDTPEKQERIYIEASYMRRHWRHLIWRDPAYNPNLDYYSDNFSLAWPPRNLDISSSEDAPREIAEGMNFSVLNNSRDFLCHFLEEGWSGLEKECVWSDGKTAELRLDFESGNRRRFYLDLEAFLPSEDFTQSIEVTGNNVTLGEVVFAWGIHRRKCYFNLPEDLGKSISLKIHIDHPVSPLEAKISKDSRARGVALYGLGLDKVKNELAIKNQMMISSESFIIPERRLTPSPWIDHLPFAQWLVSVCKPSLFVELGVNAGNSYCCVCETIKRNNINCKAYGIHGWQGEGEKQECYYENDIVSELRAYHGARYADFSNLLHATFDEAAGEFPDKSIDLLHIDGLHTYTAIKKCFLQWLAKMSDSGIIMLHDINAREENCGVWKFWDEIKSSYPSFEFHHSHGLGILLIGANQPEILSILCAAEAADASTVRNAYASLSRGENDLHASKVESKRLVALLKEKELKLGEQIREKNKLEEKIKSLQSSISWKLTFPLRKIHQLIQ